MSSTQSTTFIIDSRNIDLLSLAYIKEALKEDTEEVAEHFKWSFDYALNERIKLIRLGLCAMVASRPPVEGDKI